MIRDFVKFVVCLLAIVTIILVLMSTVCCTRPTALTYTSTGIPYVPPNPQAEEQFRRLANEFK